MLALKTIEEMERYHYITNSPMWPAIAAQHNRDHEVYDLECQVENLQAELDDANDQIWELEKEIEELNSK